MPPSKKPYKTVILGGTFDHFHKGHEALLRKATELADDLIIGLTTDDMAKRSKDHTIFPYNERKEELTSYLKKLEIKSTTIVAIEDPYGPTLSLHDIDAIVVSEETRLRAKEINEIRVKKGLKPLKIVVIRQVLAEDGKPISSARILREEIDRNGRLLKK